MYMTKQEANEREQLIFGREYDSEKYRYGGVVEFDCISYETAKTLLDRGHIKPNDSQNESPTASEFMEFIEQHEPDKWYLSGYVVLAEREDTRVTITGIGCTNCQDRQTAVDFVMANRFADKLVCEESGALYCWYD